MYSNGFSKGISLPELLKIVTNIVKAPVTIVMRGCRVALKILLIMSIFFTSLPLLNAAIKFLSVCYRLLFCSIQNKIL
jgi:hypothetical protein